MTQREHTLILMVLVAMMNRIKVMSDVLKSNGLLSVDDERAFAFAANLDALSKSALYEQAKEYYIGLAKILDVQTGLENLPPLRIPPQS